MIPESEKPSPEDMGLSKDAIDFDAAKAKANLEAKNEKDFFRQPADAAFDKKDIEFSEREQFGDVVLGTIDPRTLSEEDFRSSPELLHHGAKQDQLEFDDSVDYTGKSLETQTRSLTIGNGFYTTPEKRNAEIYSELSRGTDSEAVTQELLPFQAKMLDMRSKINPRINAPVTTDFAQEWLSFYQDYFKSQFPTGKLELEGKPISEQGMLLNWYNITSSYLRLLKSRLASGNALELRQLLDRNKSGKGSETEHASTIFTDFMLRKGYDGLIYNEGGDRADQKHITSVVFYNPKKLGMYNTWQARKP
ncbi:hypothetical protein IID23_00700 [Patescibacteria group bacterium]|nr:hypothetical protein [Patescibacteria group bacterium]